MISADYVSKMARYNRWQNESIFSAADTLADAERRQDRGAFFGSIHGTLSHLLWGDTIWMSRFAGWEAPEIGIPESADWVGEWSALKTERRRADARIMEWALALSDDELAGELSWFSGAIGREISRPLAECVTHFFNHQTHHRGQVHAMLTQAGAQPGATDLVFMPREGHA